MIISNTQDGALAYFSLYCSADSTQRVAEELLAEELREAYEFLSNSGMYQDIKVLTPEVGGPGLTEVPELSEYLQATSLKCY